MVANLHPPHQAPAWGYSLVDHRRQVYLSRLSYVRRSDMNGSKGISDDVHIVHSTQYNSLNNDGTESYRDVEPHAESSEWLVTIVSEL